MPFCWSCKVPKRRRVDFVSAPKKNRQTKKPKQIYNMRNQLSHPCMQQERRKRTEQSLEPKAITLEKCDNFRCSTLPCRLIWLHLDVHALLEILGTNDYAPLTIIRKFKVICKSQGRHIHQMCSSRTELIPQLQGQNQEHASLDVSQMLWE